MRPHLVIPPIQARKGSNHGMYPSDWTPDTTARFTLFATLGAKRCAATRPTRSGHAFTGGQDRPGDAL